MKAEEQDGNKLGFFSKIKRNIAGMSLEMAPNSLEMAQLQESDATTPSKEELVAYAPTCASEGSAPSSAQEMTSDEEELVITCEGAPSPQIRRDRGHGPTITHIGCAKAQTKWLFAEVEAVAAGENRAVDTVAVDAVAVDAVAKAPDAYPESSLIAQDVPAPVAALDTSHLSGSPVEPRTISMANNLKESLNELMQIDGAVAVALVDGNSGMAMGTAGGGPLNLEVAAAGNSEVVRSKLKVMKALNLRESIEDILITLGTQYHLIRPLSSTPEIFVYLVLNKANSNLAMARFKLASIEKELQI